MSDRKLVLTSLDSQCLYHKRAGEEFGSANIAPGGMCERAYYVSYPYYLGLLYDAWQDDALSGITFRCSQAECSSEWLIKIVPNRLAPLLRVAERIMRIIGRTLDVPDRSIVYRVLKTSEGCKMAGHEQREFKNNPLKSLLRKSDFCPQSFYAVYPYMDEKSGKLNTPWDGEQVTCPAVDQAATYSLKMPNNKGSV